MGAKATNIAARKHNKAGKREHTGLEYRTALVIAIAESADPPSLNYSAAFNKTGIPRNRLWEYKNKHPELLEELKPEIDTAIQAKDQILIALLCQNAMLSAREMNRRLNSKTEIKNFKPFDLNGIIITSVDKARLLQDKSTNNTRVDMNLTEQTIMALYDIEKAAKLAAGAKK